MGYGLSFPYHNNWPWPLNIVLYCTCIRSLLFYTLVTHKNCFLVAAFPVLLTVTVPYFFTVQYCSSLLYYILMSNNSRKRHLKCKFLFKGTVARHFRPLVFSSNSTPGFTDSWAKAVSNIDSTLKIDSAQWCTARSFLQNFSFRLRAVMHSAESRLRAVMHSAESLKFANCSANSQPYAKIV
jgi:hypothetical protein